MKLVPVKVTRNIHRQLLKTKKNSPHIFFFGGIVGVVGSTVLACRATLKLETLADEIKTDVDNAKAVDDMVKQDEKEYYKSLGYVYVRSAGKIVRLYGPAAALGAVSIGALTGSHIQMTRRNAGLTAAFAAVSKAYDDYRTRIREEVGEERELELYRCMEDVEIEGDKGKKQLVKARSADGTSPYARVFDRSSTEWVMNPEINRIFLQCQQNYFNHILNARGHVFLNEVYDALGFDRSSEGQIVGWVLNSEGDGYIDFGIFEVLSPMAMDGTERCIVLDFNVDGAVYDKI